MGLSEAVECVRKNKSFLITAHTSPEGDALGSELAFYRLVKALGKDACIVNDDNVPAEYAFIPGINNIKKYSKKNVRNIRFDCFVILDSSGLGRCGGVYELNTDKRPVLNIDHHISNENFGDINWIEPHAVSCSQMVYKLYKKMHIPLDKDIATALYAGIVSDSGSFRYQNTTSFTHSAAAELMRYDLDAAGIYRKIYENIPYLDMKLLAEILPKMRREAGGRVIWFEVKKELLKGKKIFFDLSEHILSFGRAISGVEAVVLFKENLKAEDEIRINFRSQGNVDVNKIAQSFGGGGHKTASGATVKGKIDTVRKKVLRKIKESL